MKLFKKTKKGFTLVELVVVIAVIAILSAVSVGAYFGITDSANNSRLEQEAEQIHTAIQAVSLGTDSNQSLGKDGLRVKDLDEFEKAIEKNLGVDVEVVTGETTTLKLPTIVLGNQTDVFAEHGAGTLYSTFGYLNPEIGGKKIVADVVSGDTKIVKYNFTVDNNLAPIEYTTVYWKSPFTLNGDNTYVHYVTEDGNNNGWPGTKMTHYIPVEDIFVAEVASNFTDLYFHIGTDEGNDSNQRHVERGAYSIETPYWEDGGDAWAEAPVAETDYVTTGLTAYFRAGEWETVNVYAYNIAGESNNPEQEENNGWPGKSMTAVENRNDRLYSYTFDNDYYRVIFNNGNGGEGNQTTEIPFDGFSETNCYYNGTAWTTYPDDLEITPTYRTIYVKEYEWWHKEGGNSQVYQYRIEGEEKVSINNNNSDYGVAMTHVLWDDFKYVNYRSFTFETTNNEVDGFRFYRMANGNFANAVSVDISLEDIGENNLVILDSTETWFDETNYTAVTFGDYESDSTAPASVYLKGDFNEWSVSDEYVLNRNQEGNYVIEDVEIAAGENAKVHVSTNSNGWYGYNNDMNSNYVTSADEGANILFNNTGIYKITLTVGETKKVIIEQTEDLDEPHVHEWNTDGTCKGCEETCPHENYTNGKCDVCKFECPHENYVEDICTNCGAPKVHTCEFDKDSGKCSCGEINPSYEFSSTNVYVIDDAKWSSKIRIHLFGGGTGTEWPGNNMIQVGNSPLYTFDTTADSWTQFIISKNGTPQTSDLNINDFKGKVIYTSDINGNKPSAYDVSKLYSIAGDFNGWNTNSNPLTLNLETGLFETTITDITADTLQYKIARNCSWDISYGNGSENYSFNMVDGKNTISVAFNCREKSVSLTCI